MTKLIYNWGINDSSDNVYVTEKINGKLFIVWQCPYYRDWCSMLSRVLSKSRSENYSEITICESWKYFTNFKNWVDTQTNRDWRNCELDKDFLSTENKIYSPETCVYISSQVNSFICDRKGSRGQFLIGVTFHKHRKKFVAQCANPFGKTAYEKRGYLAGFDSEEEAHLAWKSKKHEYACQLAELEDDCRVSEVLRNIYRSEL